MKTNQLARDFDPEFTNQTAQAATAAPDVEPQPSALPEGTCQPEPETPPPSPEATQTEFPFNDPRRYKSLAEYDSHDDHRANLFIDREGETLRYIRLWDRWMEFHPERGWHIDVDSGNIIYRSREFSGKLDEEVNQLNRTGRLPANLFKNMRNLGTKFGVVKDINSMLTAAASDPRVKIMPKELDADSWQLGTQNGVLDLRTGKRRSYSPDLLVTKKIGTTYDPAASCPRWEQFLQEIFPDGCDLIQFVKKAVGYSLTGDTREQVFFFLYGAGCNGKSVFIKTLSRLLGDYSTTVAPEVVSLTKHDTPSHLIADLQGARFASMAETEEGCRLAETRLKIISGEDEITAHRKYEKPFQFTPVLKLWIFGNHKPTIKGVDDGMWRRVRLIPFTRQFTGEQIDRTLDQTLLAELPGILNWSLEGCRLWQEEGLNPPAPVTAAVQDYRTDQDLLGQFIADRIRVNEAGSVAKGILFQAYKDWTEQMGVNFQYSQIILFRKLRERNVVARQGERGGYDCFLGIELR